MPIQRKRIRNVENYLTDIPQGSAFKVILALAANADAALNRAGFIPNEVQVGDAILPDIRGRVTRFNAEGRWNIRRDLPKEERYIRTVYWSWTEHHGNSTVEQSESRDIMRLCYPREHVPAPAVEVTYVETENGRYLAGPTLNNLPEQHDDIRHIINLFLELFGECDLATAELQMFQPELVRRVNWKFLPAGEHPWERLRTHIDRAIGPAGEGVVTIIRQRAENIYDHGPARIFVGIGGFTDYLAYEFPEQGYVVLESIRRDNALYVLGDNWETVSQRSKSEIINLNLHQGRIVHTKGWEGRLAEVLGEA